MILGNLQALLHEFYDLDLTHDIYDFLITDEKLADALDRDGRRADEKLLIREGEDEAQVSLYLHEGLVERLGEDDPTARLSAGNLADFWTAFEGISHFTYYAFRAEVERPVTLLEMELQAEVDKFVATALLLSRQGERLPRGLHHWLFRLPKFDAALDDREFERYERANRYASKYCLMLMPRLSAGAQWPELKRELRRFYRYSQPAKLEHIRSG